MKTVHVSIPTTGVLRATVELPDGATDDDAYAAAVDKFNSHPEECEHEWEHHWSITEGNCFYGMQNEAEFEVEK